MISGSTARPSPGEANSHHGWSTKRWYLGSCIDRSMCAGGIYEAALVVEVMIA